MMQAFIAPLAELAEYQEIFTEAKERKGDSADRRLCQFTKTHLMYALGDGFFTRSSFFPVKKKRRRHMKNIAF